MDEHLIGKNHEEIEKKFGFDYYLETKDEFLLGKKIDSRQLINAFLEFNGEKTLKVVKLYDGVIQEITSTELSDIKCNLLLLAEKKGMFYDDSDDELATSYGFLCEDYFAEVMYGIIFFSGKEESVHSFAEILDSFKIDYHEPYDLSQEGFSYQFRKLGRNEPCHCGSGKKYKKCCLEKDLKETEKPKKVKAAIVNRKTIGCIKMTDKIENEEDYLWEEGGFAETLGPQDIKNRMKTFHKKHDEDMNFNCRKCNKRISAHNKDWHAGLCDECFDKEVYNKE